MKISELTPTEILNDEDIFPVVQDGETKHIKRKDLFKHIAEPIDDEDVANKKYVDEKVKENTPTADSVLDENSTNAIQNAVVAKEIKDLKNQLYGVRLTYSHNIDNFNQPKISKTYSTDNNTGEVTYFTFFTYSCTLALIQEDVETNEITIVPRLTNIPPIEITVDENGYKEYRYNCDFTEEYLIIDYSKIDTNSSEKMLVSLKQLEELVTELGGTLSRTIKRDSTMSSVWTIVYEYRATFKNEEAWNAFYNEFLMLALQGTTAFVSEYTYLSEPIELKAEVIENA